MDDSTILGNLLLGSLPETKNDLVFADIGAVRSSAMAPDQLEAECRFLEDLGDRDGQAIIKVHHCWVPFGELAFLVPWNRYRRRRNVGLAPNSKRIRLVAFQADGVCDLVDHGGVVRMMNDGPPGFHHLTRPRIDRAYCYQTRPLPVFLPAAELLRFYFSPLSEVLGAMLRPRERGEPPVRLFDEDRTEFHEGSGVLHLFPTQNLKHPGAVMHLAMLLLSPDLRTIWDTLEQSLQAQRILGAPSYPVAWPPAPVTLTAQVLDSRVLDESGRSRHVQRVVRVISDHRRPPFKELHLHYPQTEGHVGEADPGKEFERLRLGDQVRLHPASRTLAGRRKATMQVSQLLASFPSLSAVRIRTHFGDKKTGPVRRTSNLPPVTSASTRAGGDDDNVPLLSAVPRHRPNNSEAVPAQTDLNLFEQEAEEDLRFITVSQSELVFPLAQFVEAARILEVQALGRLWGEAGPGEVTLIELSDAWGGWVRSGRERNRAACLFRFEFEGASVDAIEFERWRATDQTAIGVLAHRSGRTLSNTEIAIIVRHAARRMSGRISPGVSGPWPSSANYQDLSTTTVRHVRSRRNPQLLAEALEDAARSLLT